MDDETRRELLGEDVAEAVDELIGEAPNDKAVQEAAREIFAPSECEICHIVNGHEDDCTRRPSEA